MSVRIFTHIKIKMLSSASGIQKMRRKSVHSDTHAFHSAFSFKR